MKPEPTEVLAFRVSRAFKQQVRATAQQRGVSVSSIAEEALMKMLPELAPEAFVLDPLEGYESITIAVRPTADGDVAEVIGWEAKTHDPLGRKRRKPLPVEQLVNVEARSVRAGRTIIELVALPGTDFAGVRIYVATVPSGVPVEVKLCPEDLQPGLREVVD